MLSEIRAAFNQNVEKVLKNVNVSELLSKQPEVCIIVHVLVGVGGC